MFYSTTYDTRQMFWMGWQKHCQNQPLSALEQEIVGVILDHPEYHFIFEQQQILQASFYPELGEINPFLHMGLHLAVREQLSMDKPQGIVAVFNQLRTRYGDHLKAEHAMMDELASCLWDAQKNKITPHESHYLNALRNL